MPHTQQFLSSSLLLLTSVIALPAFAEADTQHYPVDIQSCNRTVTFEKQPKAAVSNDVNLTEMMLVLGLQDKMVGVTGISGWKTFAGWNYGMKVGGGVTPETLAPLGIKTYELTESCTHIMQKPKASMNDLYVDLLNLGRIFNVEDRANKLVKQYQKELQKFSTTLTPLSRPVKVFVYDSGQEQPFTSGEKGMPTALIEAAGGRNIIDDVAKSWTQIGWESIIDRSPEVIIIVNYGDVTAQQKIDFLSQQPALQDIPAIKNKRFVILEYVEATPGPRNIEAIKHLAKAFRR